MTRVILLDGSGGRGTLVKTVLVLDDDVLVRMSPS
jgi:hypothetical protein